MFFSELYGELNSNVDHEDLKVRGYNNLYPRGISNRSHCLSVVLLHWQQASE